MRYFPNTKTFVLSKNSFSKIVKKQGFVEDIRESLNLNQTETVDKIADFFRDKPVLVRPTGLEGFLYEVGTVSQTSGSTFLTVKTLIMSKTAGVTGAKLFLGQPFLAIALPTTGAIFFHMCAQVAGNNTVKRRDFFKIKCH